MSNADRVIEITSPEQAENLLSQTHYAIWLLLKDSISTEPMLPMLKRVSENSEFEKVSFFYSLVENNPDLKTVLFDEIKYPSVLFLKDGEEDDSRRIEKVVDIDELTSQISFFLKGLPTCGCNCNSHK